MELINFFIILFCIVMIHEAGHCVVAKLNKIRVNTFSIGFGPRIIGFKIWRGPATKKVYIAYKFFNFKSNDPWLWENQNLTEYRISPIFFGGYCKMDGEIKGTGKKHELMSKSYLQKISVALAGVFANFLTGFSAIYFITAIKIGAVRAFNVTCRTMIAIIHSICKGLLLLCQGKGEFLTASEVGQALSGFTFEYYIFFFGILSIALGICNLIPWPALDGSLPFIWLLEKFNKKVMEIVLKVGMATLIILQLIILFFWLR